MLAARRHSNLPQILALIAGLFALLLCSCRVVRNYPRDKPYVSKTNIKVISDMPNEEKALLVDRLENQLDDSVRPRTLIRYFGLRKVLVNPPVYLSANADKSLLSIKTLLASLGYFYDSSYYHVTIDSADSAEGKYPAIIDFTVEPRKLTKLDSIWYNIADSNLQLMANATMSETLLKKGEAFSKSTIASELDRLVELYRDNGYYRFSREEMVGVWDTLDISLLEPTLDPFEQVQVLQKLKERRENPTANLEIRLRPGYDTTRLVKYYVGNINVYPDYAPDTFGVERRIVVVDTAMQVIQFGRKFKPGIFPINIYLRHGQVYSQRRFQRTFNRFNAIGAWKLINIQAFPRPEEDTIDFNIELTPNTKHLFTANLEASQNQSAVAGNLFGIGVNVGVQNRNFAHAANLANTSIRYGVELGENFIQTQQVSISHNISFPRPVIFFKKWIFNQLIRDAHQDNIRTIFSLNGANTERRDLYNLTSINGVWGYEFQRTVPRTTKTHQISVRIPNIEYSYLKKRQGLKDLIIANPALGYIFTDGFIASAIVGYSRANTARTFSNILAINLEHSPFLVGFINSNFLDTNLYRFTKLNAEYTYLFKIRRSALALRLFGGIGFASGNTVHPEKRNNLPFFKQYFAGGPNSMRAWRLRRLGPGSLIGDFDENPERYGDVQLEFNAEYRFPLATIGGVRLESAIFADIGNVWLLKNAAGPPEAVFNFGRLGKDLGVGLGTGLRLDFTYFLVRVDYAFKVKDPSPDIDEADHQNKWFYDLKLLEGQLQIGINYPFKL